MGDAADDAFDAYLRDQEYRTALDKVCRSRKDFKPTDKCEWALNDDGLYECKTCGKVTDL